jgi:DNA-directed RNA polymerase subunit M/transcription elongation factor TFIIS
MSAASRSAFLDTSDLDARFELLVESGDYNAQNMRIASLRSGYACAVERFDKGSSEETVHDLFAAAFQFPPEYARNWIALQDCLADQSWNPGTEVTTMVCGVTRIPNDIARMLLICLGKVEAGWAEAFESVGPLRRVRVFLADPPDESEAVKALLLQALPNAYVREKSIPKNFEENRKKARLRKPWSPFSVLPGERHQCPVCGYGNLRYPVFQETLNHGPTPSFESCPSCGYEFGYDDGVQGVNYARYRALWIAAGMKWRARRCSPPPRGWDPHRQLESIDVSQISESHLELLRRASEGWPESHRPDRYAQCNW